MKHLLITIIAVAILAGCSDPEAEANRLFTEASTLINEADSINQTEGPYSLKALGKRKAALEILEKIPLLYPQSSLSVRISEGDFKIKNQSMDEIVQKLEPPITIHQAAEDGEIEAIKWHID
ncbi:hypothetical protein OAM03_03210, partial [Verrucomicrobia bacterium]|nr:hypothetical protein [Verrucomicrobiota bacterium]